MTAGHADSGDHGDRDALLRYAELTYRAVTDSRRRAARVALVLALLFALAAGWSGWQWSSVSTQVAAIPDEVLAEAFGVQLPDPRPPLARAELRVRAFVYGSVAVGAAALALLAVGVWALLRPPRLPPDLRVPSGAGGAPPRGDHPPM